MVHRRLTGLVEAVREGGGRMNITFNGSNMESFAAHLGTIMRKRDEAERAWRKNLFSEGIAATHPDDGWVDRSANTVNFCYPHINGKLKPGSLVALGDHEKHRIVRLIHFRPCIFSRKPTDGTWSFEEVKG